MRPARQPASRSGTYPPAVYALAEDRTAVPPATLLWWAGSTVVLGVLLGVVWWLGAPGGFLFGDPLSPDSWLLRDLTLAGLEAAAGVVVGMLLAARLELPGVAARIAAAVGGSALGSAAAVFTGQSLAVLAGPHGNSALPGSSFLLRSPGVAAIWPATVAGIVFFAVLFSLLGRSSRS